MLELMSHTSISFVRNKWREKQKQIGSQQKIEQLTTNAINEAMPRSSYHHFTNEYLTVPSTEALAILFPEAENRHRLIWLVWPKKVS